MPPTRPTPASFEGFPKDTPAFLRALARNNSEEWLETHRGRYESAILTPARGAVVAIGQALHAAGCRVVADPRVNGSIFRMARDRRFRPDVPPYKTHLALIWWAEGTRMAEPSFYLQINGRGIELGVGLPEIPREDLPTFRRWLVDDDHAERFLATIDSVGDDVEWSLEELKRVPAEFRGRDEVRSRAVRFQGGWGGWTLVGHPAEVFTPGLAEWFVARARPLMPFWRVLSEGLTAARAKRQVSRRKSQA